MFPRSHTYIVNKDKNHPSRTDIPTYYNSNLDFLESSSFYGFSDDTLYTQNFRQTVGTLWTPHRTSRTHTTGWTEKHKKDHDDRFSTSMSRTLMVTFVTLQPGKWRRSIPMVSVGPYNSNCEPSSDTFNKKSLCSTLWRQVNWKLNWEFKIITKKRGVRSRVTKWRSRWVNGLY